MFATLKHFIFSHIVGSQLVPLSDLTLLTHGNLAALAGTSAQATDSTNAALVGLSGATSVANPTEYSNGALSGVLVSAPPSTASASPSSLVNLGAPVVASTNGGTVLPTGVMHPSVSLNAAMATGLLTPTPGFVTPSASTPPAPSPAILAPSMTADPAALYAAAVAAAAAFQGTPAQHSHSQATPTTHIQFQQLFPSFVQQPNANANGHLTTLSGHSQTTHNSPAMTVSGGLGSYFTDTGVALNAATLAAAAGKQFVTLYLIAYVGTFAHE